MGPTLSPPYPTASSGSRPSHRLIYSLAVYLSPNLAGNKRQMLPNDRCDLSLQWDRRTELTLRWGHSGCFGYEEGLCIWFWV